MFFYIAHLFILKTVSWPNFHDFNKFWILLICNGLEKISNMTFKKGIAAVIMLKPGNQNTSSVETDRRCIKDNKAGEGRVTPR